MQFIAFDKKCANWLSVEKKEAWPVQKTAAKHKRYSNKIQ